VYDVLSYLASGMTEEEILSDYPDLTHDDILASLSYARIANANRGRALLKLLFDHIAQARRSSGGPLSGQHELAVLRGAPPKIIWVRIEQLQGPTSLSARYASALRQSRIC
jgi:hypothetical protein